MFRSGSSCPSALCSRRATTAASSSPSLRPTATGARAGVREGDLLRACSAVRTVLINEPPGSSTPRSPKPRNSRSGALSSRRPTSNRTCHGTRSLSNREAPELPAVLLFERASTSVSAEAEIPAGRAAELAELVATRRRRLSLYKNYRRRHSLTTRGLALWVQRGSRRHRVERGCCRSADPDRRARRHRVGGKSALDRTAAVAADTATAQATQFRGKAGRKRRSAHWHGRQRA